MILNWLWAALVAALSALGGYSIFCASFGMADPDGLLLAILGQALMGTAFGIVADMFIDPKTPPHPGWCLLGALVFVGGWPG